ncbi:MAG TPA: lipoprotein-releasing ABC transporter permease subunit [Ferrovibrio sp.]|uniref:lipoprotein-releasing ABC transporter permease subunit n=1 Tax=Ferrovibrio sp. TaxID=1917215 RepID=UPI002B4ACDF7|nr:lipoprotein-releasing ABC transporter permease subunit [Ferrovibrio sp.]HLT77481.1 lipoprotein-releasing ABC transporter permease subunit [Ferrovibrio sp.]
MPFFSRLEWLLALRYLRARRQEGFISVIAVFSFLGIMLGVATLIIVMSVMNGFRAELMGRILGLNGHLTIHAEAGTSLRDFEFVTEAVAGMPGVVRANPIIEGQVMATANNTAAGVVVRGVRQEDLSAEGAVARGIVQGSLQDFTEDGVAIGHRLARKLGLRLGDQLTLISPQSTATPFGTVPRLARYQIAAIFDVGMFEYDSSFVYMPMETAQVYFRMPDQASSVEVRLAEPEQARQAARQIGQRLGPQYRLYDWQQANAHFVNALEVERNVMFLILTLIIVVAAFNIISSMIMLVKDKGRDIAILRTMGTSRGTIMRVFVIAGASIGVLGTAAGFALGLAFSLNIERIRQVLQSITGTELFSAEIYFLSKLPAKVDSTEVMYVVVMGLALSLLATLYPSWRAARLDPVEALRYE